MGDYQLQHIIPDNYTLLRAFSNGYIWFKNIYYDIEHRNLGYYNQIQTELTKYFRGSIIKWLINKNNLHYIETDLKDYIGYEDKTSIMNYINRFTMVSSKTTGIVELYILNKIFNIPIIVSDDYDVQLYEINDGIKKNTNIPTNKRKDYINIQYIQISINNIPLVIGTQYFK